MNINVPFHIHCRGCGLTPDELPEYVELARVDDYASAEEAVRSDGTFNWDTGRFWCTTCYIKAGMPLGTA